MLKLFSTLSQTKVRLCKSENELEELRKQLEISKSQISQLTLAMTDMHDCVAELRKKVKEVGAVNEIILNVQQGLLEELAYAGHQQQQKSLPLFPLKANDDDDLPN